MLTFTLTLRLPDGTRQVDLADILLQEGHDLFTRNRTAPYAEVSSGCGVVAHKEAMLGTWLIEEVS